MLRSLQIENFTVFSEADLEFGRNLNVVIGENGSGKSHLLKAAYCALSVSASGSKATTQGVPASDFLATAFADKLRGVFKPDSLGRLASRIQGHKGCRLAYRFEDSACDMKIGFSTKDQSKVKVVQAPKAWIEKPPVFLPTRELLSIYPNFVSVYDNTTLSFEETWRDTCSLLGLGLARGPRERATRKLLDPLEEAMGGSLELDKSGRFYLNIDGGSMEMHLVAEGLRKLATVARLIANGALLDRGYLFWDEPEANLNPKVIKSVAKTILQVAQSGIQVFIASHSLFLLRELFILQQSEFANLDARCFGLHANGGGVALKQGKTIDDVGDITALDEELQQSDRYRQIA